MDRRGFLIGLIGGVAIASAARAWPFRVFSFPNKVVINPIMDINAISSKYLVPVLGDEIFRPSPLFYYLREREEALITCI